MKHNHNHDNAPNLELPLVPVHFELAHATALSVCIAGTFNHWQPDAKPMRLSGKGQWQKDSALAPGTYEYCFVVDGQWMPDPQSTETVSNPFGGRNSVLTVAATTGAVHAAAASLLPLKNSFESKTTL